MHTVNMVNYLLRQIGRNAAVRVLHNDGSVYDDDVSSYHLCELLLRMDPHRYREYIDSVLGYYWRHSVSHQNPFMLNALVLAEQKDSESRR